MARTIRDIPVYGRNELDIVNGIIGWSKARGGTVVGGSAYDPRGTHLDIEQGAGIWQLKRHIEVTLQPIQGGYVVHTEGYAKEMLSGELDLSPNALNAALPRRQGWQEINDLWNWVAQLSAPGAAVAPPIPPAPSPPQPAPAYPPAPSAVPAGPVARFCTQCGTPFIPNSKFCGKCGARLGV